MRKYNYKKIKNKVVAIVKRANYSPNNAYKDTVWQFHVSPVVEHSLKLGRKLGADLEVLELAALLHDLASITNKEYIKEHHAHGARLAGEILSDFGLSKEKIIKVKNCILNHRASQHGPRKSLEEKILASADAMSHFTELADMMYLAYGVHGFKTVDGALWLKAKLQRSWQKIIPAGRRLIKEDYRVARRVLDKVMVGRKL